MKTGKTKSGFEWEVKDGVLDNMELVEAIAEAEENFIAAAKLTTLLLGKDQKKRMYDFLRKDDGTVPVNDVSSAIAEIFEAIGEDGKN